MVELYLVEIQLLGAVEHLQEGAADALHREDQLSGLSAAHEGFGFLHGVDAQIIAHGLIVAVDLFHQQHQQHDGHQRDPGAAEEFHDDDDYQRKTRDQGAEAVDPRLELPAGAFILHPVADHAELT